MSKQGILSSALGKAALAAGTAFAAIAILTVTPSSADVVMGANACAAGFDDLGVKYTNNNPDPWDMRGYGMSIGAGNIRGSFAAQASGGYLVPPAGTAAPFFQSCNGNVGVAINRQLEAKIGACNEPDPPKEPLPLTCAEINPNAAYYNASQCLPDGLGVNRGDGYGGFIDSYQGQTQIQVAIPNTTVNLNGAQVRFDPASMGGPFYMMSMVALQEYLYVDMQFLLAMGASTTGAGLVNAAGTSLYVSPPNTGTDIAPYGSFKVTYLTATGRLYGDYPKYFSGLPNMNKLVSTNGAGPTLANSPQHLNSGFLAAMNLWWLFDGLKAAQNLCFRQYLQDATDKSAGLKLMLGGYHIGPNLAAQAGESDDYATHNLPANATLLAAADVTPMMKKFVWDAGGPDFNTHNHITRVFTLLNQLTTSNTVSAACGGALPIYDAGITLTQMRELFFGQGGTAATQGNGGLLWHFNIPAASRQVLWTDLDCAFNSLKGKAPGRAAEEISFRYDFLTLLRVARQHFAGYVNKYSDRPTPSSTYSSEWSIWVFNHSNAPCNRVIQDVTWPTLRLTDTLLDKGAKVEQSATDNRGLKSREFSIDNTWRSWQPTDANFAVPATMTAPQRLWYRVTDSCGNSVIQEVKWKDVPPLPVLPTPVASPGASNFFNSIAVTLSVPGHADAQIRYTLDGSVPTAASPLYTGPITISGTTTTLKAIGIKSGYQNSLILVVTYTKVAMPVANPPVLNPPARNFTTLDPDFTVSITAEPGAVILVSTDGNDPDTVPTARTLLYGGPINVSGTLTIKAIAKLPDHLNSSVAVGQYTETPAPKVGTPVANPGATSFVQGPLNVSLTVTPSNAVIYYSLNGGAPQTYNGLPISIAGTTTLKAWATLTGYLPSDTLTALYTYTPPVSVKKAWYLDKDGDGQIETVLIDFDKAPAAEPTRLTFTITDKRGVTETRNAAAAEIALDGTRVTVTLANPFGFGITSVANMGNSGQQFKQDNIPLLDGFFAVDDSVAAVITDAEVLEPDTTRPLKQIMVTYSEPVTFPPASPDAIVFKRESAEMPAGAVKFASNAVSQGALGWVFSIDSTSTLFPIVDDSVAINTNGQTRDAAQNTPARKLFRNLKGKPPAAKPSRVYVTFPNGTMIVPRGLNSEPSTPADVVFIPVGHDATALSGTRANGKCQGCAVGENGNFVGPVLFMEIPGACEYDFKIFNNVGEFVVAGKGRIEDSDIASLTPIKNGTMYRIRIIWTGRTAKETKAGTGAYVLQAVIKTGRNLKTGAPPATDTHRVKFGLLRNYRGS